MKTAIQSLGVGLLRLLSFLPFRIMYMLSDFLYVMVFHMTGYRKRVVYENLRNSFPEKDDKEIERIARRFYKHFCDLLVESIKFPAMSDKQLYKRAVIKHAEKTIPYFNEGRDYLLLGMHYNNWEWCSSMQRLPEHPHLIVIVYSPLSNKPMERYMLNMRERFGSQSVDMAHAARAGLKKGPDGRPSCLFLAADQTPPREARFWTTFLNQETPFFSGPEKIAIKTNRPVFLLHTKKIKRGMYETDFIELFADPAKETPDGILLAYIDKIEEIIKEQPEYWLWSHRRWKHKRPEGVSLIPRNQT